MATETTQLLTIFTEALLEDAVIEDIMAEGSSGYTVSDARGNGTHGRRSGRWTPGANIRVEVLGTAELCGRIIKRLQEKYGRHYGLLMFTTPVTRYNDDLGAA